MKLVLNMWEHQPPTPLQAWPQGLKQDSVLPFSINIQFIHTHMQTNIEMRTILKGPTKQDANQ